MTKFLNISTDTTLGGNSPSDDVVSSQKAIKNYADSKVAKSGDQMTGILEFLSTSSYIRFKSSITNTKLAIMHDSWYSIKILYEASPTDGIEINTSIPLIAPITNDTGRVGDSSRKWASVYSTSVYTTKINNGADITVPATSGTLALTSDIPTVNNPTITITQGGVTKGSFTLNQASGDTIALDAGGGGGSYTAGDGIDITSNVISAIGLKNKNTAAGATNPVYDWVGTLAEYTSQAVATNHPDWLCYITDDLTAQAYSAYTQSQTDTLLAGKVSTGHEVIEFQAPTAGNNYTWYRKYADGWVEQGGYRNGKGAVSLLVNMANTYYTALIQSNTTGSDYHSYDLVAGSKTTSGFTILSQSTPGETLFWYVSGMAAAQ